MEFENLNAMRSVEELESRRGEVASRIVEIDGEYGVQPLPDDVRSEFFGLTQEREEIDKRITEYEGRKAVVDNVSQGQRSRENGDGAHFRVGSTRTEGDIFDLSTVRSDVLAPERMATEMRDRAKRAVELADFPHTERAGAQEQVSRLIARLDGEEGFEFSRHLLLTGSPSYRRAFGKYLAQRGMTSEEQRSLDHVRALSLAGASGGFAVPFDLDPTIINTSNGVVNPIRELARVIPITTDEWRGVSSTGITATYEAEATETTDNAPTLVQPTISTEKAQAFVPFSIEVGQDWSGLEAEMGELLRDAKDTLEAQKFVNGSGTNEPFGVITGTTNTVNAAAGQTFTLANLYALVAALPPRYRPRAAFAGDLQIANRIRQFDTVGSSAAIWQDSLQADTPATLLGKPFLEASEMADAPATGAKFLLYGDFTRYVIVDRIGLGIEVIPHLFGANRRPTGQRGLYAYWRNGAKVIDANAFRALLGVV